jgi:hypothetical protein
MATIHVAHTGSDANSGSSLGQAKRTATAGLAAAVSGDTVLIYGTEDPTLVYNETIGLKSGVAIRGEETLPRPVFDSNYTKGSAINSSGAGTNVLIRYLEIRRYLNRGIVAYGSPPGHQVHNNVVEDCHIHHIEGRRTVTAEHAYGCYLAYGNWTVRDCEIHHIHGWNESTGIWFGNCKNHVADANTIYSIRKEGIRSYMGLYPTITNNVIFLCWYGICANEDASGLVMNNWVSHCSGCINPKHTNDPLRVFRYWGLEADAANQPMYRWWHNTFHRALWAQNVVAINDNGDGTGDTWDFDQRNNIYSGRSPCATWDSPSFRSGIWVHDYNLYSTQPDPPLGSPNAIGSGLPNRAYKTTYTNGAGQLTLAEVQATTTRDQNSFEADPEFNDPTTGDFDYPDTSPAHNAGVDLTAEGSPHGQQMGARGLTPHRDVHYTGHTLNVVSSSFGTGGSLRDENFFSNNSLSLGAWIIFDFGSTKTFNHIFGENYTHANPRNPKVVRFETAAASSGPWTIITEYQIHDSGGASWKIELASPATARYLRWTIVSSFTTSTAAADLKVGFLTNQSATPDPDPGDTTAPGVTLTAPVTGETLMGDITLNATASDNIGVARVDFYADDVLLISSDETDPYTTVWSTTPQDVGPHTLTARAYDAAGNVGISAPVIVTIDTPVPEPEPEDEIAPYWGTLVG